MTAFFAAMVYVMTSFVRIPTHQGYIHLGDGVIYLAASLLPTPYAMAAGAIGGGLSDYLSGYPLWIIPTVIIKALTASLFSASRQKIITRRNIIPLAPAAIICIGGYYLAAVILYGSWVTPIVDIPTNAIQVAAASVLYIVLGFTLDKLRIKSQLS